MKPHITILIAFFSVALLTGLISCTSDDADYLRHKLQPDKVASQAGIAIPSGHSISGSMGTPLPEPYANQVKDIVKKYPWYGGINPMWPQKSEGNYYNDLAAIFKDAPVDSLVVFAEHPVEYVRTSVQQEVQRRLYQERDQLLAAFEKGTPRIQYELYSFLNKEDYRTWEDGNKRYEYFNKILEDPNGKVYGSDFKWISNYRYADKSGCPVDLKLAYLRLLQSEFIMDRIDAMNGLTSITGDVDEIITALIKFVEKPDEYPPGMYDGSLSKSQRAAACFAIGSFREKAQNAVPVLQKALNDPDMKVRYYASTALYLIGYETQSQIDFLSKQMSDAQSPENLAMLIDGMLSAGIDMKPFFPKLGKLTRSDDKNVRQKAMQAISRNRDKDFLLALCAENLKSSNPDIRLEAVNTLGYSSHLNGASEMLFDALKDSDINVKSAACNHLLRAGTSKSVLLPYMIEILSSGEQQISYGNDMVREIRSLGPAAKQAVPALLKFLGKGNSNESKYIIDTIIEIGGTYDQIVKKLIEVIKEDDSAASERAIATLGEMGAKSLEALPAIRDYIDKMPDIKSKDRDRKLHPYDKWSLESSFDKIIDSVKPGQKIPTQFLYYILETNRKDDMERAINHLVWSGESWDKILNHLEKLLDSKKNGVRDAVLRELGDLGSQAVCMIPHLLSAAESARQKKENTSNYYDAIDRIVASLGPSDKDSVKYILPLVGIDNDSYGLSKKATRKIFIITGSNDLVADRLLELLKKADKQNRYKLIEQLRDLGESSYKAVPVLHEMMKNGDFDSYWILTSIIDSMVKSQDKRVDKDFILDMLDVFRSTQQMKEYSDLYIKKGGSCEKLGVRLAGIVGSKDHSASTTARSVLWGMGVNAKSALPGLKELYQKSNLDASEKRILGQLIEEIQMAIQKAEKESNQ